MKLGVLTDCFKEGVDKGISLAGDLGFDGVQIYATRGVFSADGLNKEARVKYKKLLRDNKLEISALCGDMGGHGYQIAADNPLRIEKTKRIIDIAEDFETSVVTTHIGVIPADKREERYKVMLDALTACGNYAKTRGVTLAIETGPEKAVFLKAFLDRIDSKGIGVNYDPANLVMVTGVDPIKGVHTLGDKIVHTHAKDGIMLKQTDPAVIYGYFADGGIEDMRMEDYFKELPLGKGNVDVPAWIAALSAIDYNGYVTIEREVGANPVGDISMAVSYLREIMQK